MLYHEKNQYKLQVRATDPGGLTATTQRPELVVDPALQEVLAHRLFFNPALSDESPCLFITIGAFKNIGMYFFNTVSATILSRILKIIFSHHGKILNFEIYFLL